MDEHHFRPTLYFSRDNTFNNINNDKYADIGKEISTVAKVWTLVILSF